MGRTVSAAEWARRQAVMRRAVRNAHAVGPVYADAARRYLETRRGCKHQDLYDELGAMEVGDELRWRPNGSTLEAIRALACNRAKRLGFLICTRRRRSDGALAIERLA